MPFKPDEMTPASLPYFEDSTTETDVWVPYYSHACTFGPDLFSSIMMNMVHNPNINSTWLFRADILFDDGNLDELTPANSSNDASDLVQPVVRQIPHIPLKRTLVRRLIPRSERRDKPLNQTCTFHTVNEPEILTTSLVIYVPHASVEDLPFYHPKVRGIAHLHQWNHNSRTGTISVHFLGGSPGDLVDPKLRRVAFHLLEVLHRHGEGSVLGYAKRVHHDLVIPRATFQNRYAQLKSKYSRRLIQAWAESTDPGKHVFEDLGIAAFLIELWIDMYSGKEFPGFVDIGCGNGLLVYLLTQEGYSGWGFDARARKSWANYTTPTSASPSGRSLEERLLFPSIISAPKDTDNLSHLHSTTLHDGVFKPGTFIVSNHADELTPWTPILGTISHCPYIMIPCCSHSLAGEKYRPPPPRDKSKPKSTYASLVDWVSQIAEDCGWQPETEMLRIPSTRNTGILGRSRSKASSDIDIHAILQKYGGVEGYYENVMKLVKTGPPSH
ncbi:tRNA (uracil-O(2)-)-methyltransferase [Metarhizium album ARSEF 1941]|uniref:tRNA (uracil-O(2)-)-methyltransferase n=1 Tax=Metarhizium album (strain ARSEF 1941) TaxID=1081103 RepID=A0A0B2X3P7_METAS|nr:tRNA (uracil-O(2)-)-methyltransferase [Metarhizium album ARSEF 1941]KHO00974.1 tRNA (uracil-O(2)-)-methyltransferase [Metarhizium album ARSEF 1941]